MAAASVVTRPLDQDVPDAVSTPRTDLSVVLIGCDDLATVLRSLDGLAAALVSCPDVEVELVLVGDREGAARTAAQAVAGAPVTALASTGRGGRADVALGLGRTATGSAKITLTAGEVLQPSALLAALRGGGEPWDGARHPVWTAPTGFPTQRRHLVFLRAGAESLHPAWNAPDRTFDIVVDAWAGNAEDYVGTCDQLYDGLAETWTLAAHAFFTERPELLDHYDAVWVANDDIEASAETVDALFALHGALGYALAQPALTPDSHSVHSIVLQHDGLAVRETNFVESMVPLWRSDVLRACLGTYADFPRGYGQDSVWPVLVAALGGRCAVYDCLPVRHTRPAGANGAQGVSVQQAIDRAVDGVSRYGLPPGILAKVVLRAWDDELVELPRERLYCRLEAAFPRHRLSPLQDWDQYALAMRETRHHLDEGVLRGAEEWRRGPDAVGLTVLLHCGEDVVAARQTLDSVRTAVQSLPHVRLDVVLLAPDEAVVAQVEGAAPDVPLRSRLTRQQEPWRAFAEVRDVPADALVLSLRAGEVVVTAMVRALLPRLRTL